MTPFEQWLKTRPMKVQELAEEFPYGAELTKLPEGDRWFVVGWTEDDKIIVSATNPLENYAEAVRTSQYICADHMR